ncbi:MAG: ATP-binding protein [Flavitalea sp.]
MKVRISPAIQLAFTFLLFGALWIFLTDFLSLKFSNNNIPTFVRLQMYKGVLFVGLAALLIFYVSKRLMTKVEIANLEREEILKKNHDLEMTITDQKLMHKSELDRQTIVAQEAERTKLGEELHDNVNQLLGVVKLYIEHAQVHPEVRQEMLKKSADYLVQVINEIRSLSKSLISPSLTEKGLMVSINELIDSILEIKDIRIDLVADKFSEDILTGLKKIMIYRIIQEHMNNVLKHSQAKRVALELIHIGPVIQLNITDNGIGFDAQAIMPGAGLVNIRHRLEVFNGKLSIETAPGKGCKLEAVFEV